MFNKSFPRTLIKRPIGVTTKKKTIPTNIGAIKDPKTNPNLNHILFKGLNNFEFITPKIKKTIEIKIAQIKIAFPDINGHKPKIKKTTENTIPKLLFELIFILDVCVINF